MPRRPRLVAPNIPLHIIQRGNNRNNCFFENSDYLVYLDLLRRSSVSESCRIHAYVLMSNHIHILVSPSHERAPGNMMKSVGERYVQYVNRRYNRSGTLWQGRFRSCPVQDDAYLIVCQRYIEMNPVRAGMVSHPSLYQWSSHRRNAYGSPDALVTPHPIVDALGIDDFSRAHAYRNLFSEDLPEKKIAELRDATNSNYVFGNDGFAVELALELGRQVARVSTTRRISHDE